MSCRYLSMSKELVRVTVRVSSTTAKDRDTTVTTVLPLLRPRLARAMAGRETPLPDFFSFRFPPSPSVYRTASMGETLAAIPAGLGAGEEDRKQGEQGRPHKDHRVQGDDASHPVQLQQ